MEKVIILWHYQPSKSLELNEINKHLKEGWSVKSVTASATRDYETFIFVLEKKNFGSD